MELSFMDYFDSRTMSLHLKEGMPPIAKRGEPGCMGTVELGSPLDGFVLKTFIDEIMEEVAMDHKSFKELEYEGATVVQLRDLRITITEPPVSEAIEITVVKPVIKRHIDEYKLPVPIKERLLKGAQGILIAGAPGAGKSTFAQAVADMYADLGLIVKTMEQPRDLQVHKGVTQYAPIEGDMAKTADILLLVRPDFTVYDEVRKSSDFDVFADMRLAGVGMVGVVHATRPIDAIQRAVSRMELGVIPSIIDTVIFIDKGNVGAIYELELVVKPPSGMQEADLARPVVEVSDFMTNNLKYEIYTFGQQIACIALEDDTSMRVDQETFKAAMSNLENEIRRAAPGAQFTVDLLEGNKVMIYIDRHSAKAIIGKRGQKIRKIERKTGLSIMVESIETIGGFEK